MKRISASILALGLLFALAGCRGNSNATEEQTAEPLVTSYIAMNKNQRFPLINLDFPEAARINAEVRAQYDRIMREEAAYETCDFFFALHGDALSLILCRASDWGDYAYRTYHMNIKTGEPVTNGELLGLAGWAQDELLENLRRKIEHFYAGTENLPDEFPHAEYRAKALRELEDIESLRLYINETGRVFWAAELASMGGAEAYEVLMDPAQPDEAYSGDRQWTGRWEMLE
jgi:hypothetical protein